MNGGPGTNWGARRAEQFPQLGNYTLTPELKILPTVTVRFVSEIWAISVLLSVWSFFIDSFIELVVLFTFSDVTKFKFEFDDVQTSHIFNRFEIRGIFEAPCCRMRIVENRCSSIDFTCTESLRAQTSLFF